jgi:hypothetical protein
VPPQTQYINSQFGQCPDGTILELALYDPDANDPKALVIVYKRGDHVVAALDSRTRVLTLASGLALPIEQAAARWATPCDLPAGAGV